jgi:chloride channel 3/4/5
MIRSDASRSRSRPRIQTTRSTSYTSSLRHRTPSATLDPEDDPASAQATTTEHVIQEEIAEIKRYEDFTTIDWVQDAAREALRRKARRKERSVYWDRLGPGRGWRWRRRVAEAYDAGQAWIVVTLVGAAIGLNAAVLNIVTEWLSDVKLGHCETAFYLNENFCCWGAESGMLKVDTFQKEQEDIWRLGHGLGWLADCVQDAPNGNVGAVFGL